MSIREGRFSRDTERGGLERAGRGARRRLRAAVALAAAIPAGVTPFVIAGTVAAPMAHAATAPITEFAIPTSGSTPTRIAAGPDGNLWFTEHSGNNIGRITTAGVVTEYPIPTAASTPTGIVAGPDGNLWFAEKTGNNIGRITPSGTITEFAIPTAASGATSIAAGPDGNVWFAENAAYQIGRITPAGVITEFQAGASPGGITAGSDGNLWFTQPNGCPNSITPAGTVTNFCASGADARNQIIITGLDGNLWFLGYKSVGTMTTAATGVNGFTTPNEADIANGPNSALWLADPSGYVDEISTSGMLTQFVIPTAGGNPAGITEGSDGNMWFTESTANMIGRLQVPATCAKETLSLQNPTTGPGVPQTAVLQVMDCGTAPLANMTTQTTTTPPNGCGSAPAITEASATPLGAGASTAPISTTFLGPSCIGTYGITSQVLDGTTAVTSASTTYDDAVGAGALYNTGTTRPFYVTSGSDGNLWYTSYSSDLGQVTPSGVITVFSTAFQGFGGVITTGSDGDMYVNAVLGPYNARHSDIANVQPGGYAGTTFKWEVPVRGAIINDLAPGPDGNVWFTAQPSAGSGGIVGFVTPAGKVKQFVLPPADGMPSAITSGSDAALWFSLSSGQIGRISTAGAVTLFPVPTPMTALTGASGSLALGPDGNVWFLGGDSSGNGFLGRISPSGAVSEFATFQPSGRATGITAGADGNLWFNQPFLGFCGYGGGVGRATPSGVVTDYNAGCGDTNAQFNIVAGPDGNVWNAAYYGIGINVIATGASAACTAVSTSVSPSTVPQGSPETVSTVIGNCDTVPHLMKLQTKTTPPSGCGTPTTSTVHVPLQPRVQTTSTSTFTAPTCAGTYKVKSTLVVGTAVVGSAATTYQVT